MVDALLVTLVYRVCGDLCACCVFPGNPWLISSFRLIKTLVVFALKLSIWDLVCVLTPCDFNEPKIIQMCVCVVCDTSDCELGWHVNYSLYPGWLNAPSAVHNISQEVWLAKWPIKLYFARPILEIDLPLILIHGTTPVTHFKLHVEILLSIVTPEVNDRCGRGHRCFFIFFYFLFL